MADDIGANDSGTGDNDEKGLVTGTNHAHDTEGDGATNPEEFASSESDLALSNQVAEREQDDA